MRKIFFSLAAISVGIQAENIALADILVTTATKTEKKIEGISASVIVVDRRTIERIGAATLGDVLSRTPGLTRQYGTFPSASSASKSSISIRGMGATGTLFLVDGDRLAGEVNNPYELDRIPAGAIERIEIVRGPMSTLYGADAVGGVVNIIMKKANKDGFQGSFAMQTGSNADGEGKNHNVDINIRGKSGKLKYSAFASTIKSTPFTQNEEARVGVRTPNGAVPPSKHPHPGTANMKDIYNTDVTYRERADVFNVGGKLGYALTDALEANIAFSYMDEERDGVYNGFFHPSGISVPTPKGTRPLPVFNVPVNSHDINTRRNITANLQWSASDDLFLKLNVHNSYYEKRNTTTMRHWADFGFASEEASASSGMRADVNVDVYEFSGNYVLSQSHILTFGAEHRGETRDASLFSPGPEITREEVDFQAIYLQDEWEVSDTLNVIYGARYDAISNAENRPTFKVGAVQNFSPLLNLRANFAQGYRAPDIREMYINRQTPRGLMQGAYVLNYNLKPEFTNSFEVGTMGRKDKFSYSATIFHNSIEDRIQMLPGAVPRSFTFENVSEAKTEGFELALNYALSNALSMGATWDELRTEDENSGRNLQFNPDRILSFKTDYQYNENLGFGLLAIYTGEQHYVDVTPRGQEDMITNPFTLVDLTSSYKFGNQNKYEVYGGINNILGEEVDDILGSNVGRYYFAGIRINF